MAEHSPVPGASAARDGAQRRVWVALAQVLAAGFLLRVLVGLLFQSELYGVGGKTIYVQAAWHLLAGNGFAHGRPDDPQPLGYVQPLYALYLAAQLALAGFTVGLSVLAGLGLAWWRRRSAGVYLLSMLVLLNAVELVAAYPDTRYRLAVEPYLALFAGLGATYLWAAAARRWWGSRAGLAG